MNYFLKILTIALFIISCSPVADQADVPEIDLNVQIDRFEQDLFSAANESDYEDLRKKYPVFFEIFMKNIIGFRQENGQAIGYYLNSFVKDAYVKEIWEVSQKEYPDLNDLQQAFASAFSRYAYYFPEKTVPRVISYISGFNYTIIVDDSLLGFGLDMYLGSECTFYPKLGFPKYKLQNMNREHIVSDCMRGWIATEYEPSKEENDLLGQMIYQGKLLYALDLLLPETEDHIKAGYTAEQIDWCNKNEADIWSHFIERELLYKQDNSVFIKYMNEGPFTPGFPEGSPGEIGKWVGWQIVRKYMLNNATLTLEELFENKQSAAVILKESLYKPKR